MTTIYDFEAQQINGKNVPLSQYKGRAMLIVNTASACGFTPQFAGLEALHKAYADKGLVVLGFPCNQFGAQDAGSNAEIAEFCQLNYGVSFPDDGQDRCQWQHSAPALPMAYQGGTRPLGHHRHQVELHQVFGR